MHYFNVYIICSQLKDHCPEKNAPTNTELPSEPSTSGISEKSKADKKKSRPETIFALTQRKKKLEGKGGKLIITNALFGHKKVKNTSNSEIIPSNSYENSSENLDSSLQKSSKRSSICKEIDESSSSSKINSSSSLVEEQEKESKQLNNHTLETDTKTSTSESRSPVKDSEEKSGNKETFFARLQRERREREMREKELEDLEELSKSSGSSDSEASNQGLFIYFIYIKYC